MKVRPSISEAHRLHGYGAWAPWLIAAAVFAIYANSFSVPFLLDDQGSILENETIRRLWPIWEPLSPPADSGNTVSGRPLLNLSFAINYAISGTDVWSYHLANIAIHALAALTLFGLVRRTLLLRSPSHGVGGAGRVQPGIPGAIESRSTMVALCVALLWALHPLQTESVTYIVQRAESMVSLFYLFTLYAFARSLPGIKGSGRESLNSRPEEERRRGPEIHDLRPDPLQQEPEGNAARIWKWLSLGACLLGMASKEVMVTAPVAVFLYDRTFGAGTFREAWRSRWVFYLTLGASWLLLAWLIVRTGSRGGSAGVGAGAEVDVDSWTYALTQCRAIIHYLRLSVWPSPLVFDYGMGVVREVLEVAVQGVLIVCMLGGTVYALRRWPKPGFVAAMFFLVLAPTSSVVPVVTQTMAEHRMYLALAVVAVLVVVAAETWLKDKVWMAFAPLVLFLAASAAARNHVYQDPLRLWQDSVAKFPESARAQNNVAALLTAAGRPDEAIPHYREALRIRPDYIRALSNLGALLMRRGEVAEALEKYGAILRIHPDFEGHYTYSRMLENAGRRTEAIEHVQEAIRLRPDSVEAHTHLANILLKAGKTAEADVEAGRANALRAGRPAGQ